MTFSQVEELFDYWKRFPPANELLAARYGYKPQLSAEDLRAQGALGPDDMLALQSVTGGKIDGISPV